MGPLVWKDPMLVSQTQIQILFALTVSNPNVHENATVHKHLSPQQVLWNNYSYSARVKAGDEKWR